MKNLKIKIFADGANEEQMLKLSKLNYIKGLTTNPSLMKKPVKVAGIKKSDMKPQKNLN